MQARSKKTPMITASKQLNHCRFASTQTWHDSQHY
jgi:hypothetical protein